MMLGHDDPRLVAGRAFADAVSKLEGALLRRSWAELVRARAREVLEHERRGESPPERPDVDVIVGRKE